MSKTLYSIIIYINGSFDLNILNSNFAKTWAFLISKAKIHKKKKKKLTEQSSNGLREFEIKQLPKL